MTTRSVALDNRTPRLFAIGFGLIIQVVLCYVDAVGAKPHVHGDRTLSLLFDSIGTALLLVAALAVWTGTRTSHKWFWCACFGLLFHIDGIAFSVALAFFLAESMRLN